MESLANKGIINDLFMIIWRERGKKGERGSERKGREGGRERETS